MGSGARAYIDAINLCVQDNMRTDMKPAGEAVVAFEVRSARFVNPHLTRASGSPAFDHAALDAVKACSARVGPPDYLRDTLARDGLAIVLVPHTQRHGPVMATSAGAHR